MEKRCFQEVLPNNIIEAYKNLNHIIRRDEKRKKPIESLKYTASKGYEIMFMKIFNQNRSSIDIPGLAQNLIDALPLNNWRFLIDVIHSFDKDIHSEIILTVLYLANPKDPKLVRFLMLLIENRAVVNDTVLEYATQNSSLDVIKVILEPAIYNRVNLDLVLKSALDAGRKDVIQILLEYGANPSILTPTEQRLYVEELD